jgi:hypothetical protein
MAVINRERMQTILKTAEQLRKIGIVEMDKNVRAGDV